MKTTTPPQPRMGLNPGLRPWNFGADIAGHVWEFVSYPWVQNEIWYINARHSPDDPTSMKTIYVTDIIEVCPV